jgi:8-oxo-dGTP diphosphatase
MTDPAMIDRFNIRIYGIVIENERVLVTDEYRLGIFMTKFPGGGLKFGEGTLGCLHREFLEELNSEIDIVSHYYTTDFFQATNLLPFTFQLINVYYLVKVKRPFSFTTTELKNDFKEVVDGAQNFRWVPLKDLSEDEFTFPVDRKVALMLRNGYIPPDTIKLP